jgi:hypothetical protein
VNAPVTGLPAALVRRARGTWTWFTQQFAAEGFFDLLAATTILALLLHLDAARRLEEIITIVCVAGLVDRRLARQAVFWFLLTALLAINHVLLWDILDNHKYLQTYWCLAMGTACLLPDRRTAAALNARLLIGLCFLFATAWKLLSPEFTDGAFFHFTMLTDRRFSGFTDLIGGVPAAVTAANDAAIQRLLAPYGGTEIVTLVDSPRVALLASAMTWWTIAIEGTIALVYLAPERWRLSRFRDAALLLFMLTTYAVATVVGFGRLLAVMGLAQSENRMGVERAAYVTCFLLLPLFEFPFAKLIRLILQ